MTSRRRVGNTGNSTPVEKKTYELRGRTINAGEHPFHSPSVSTITNPQTPEPGSREYISDIVRPVIKSAAKEKDRTLEHSVKNISTRRTTRLATPEMDDNSDDGSDYDNSSRSGGSENDRQPYVPTTAPPSTRSAKKQPSLHPDDDPTYYLVRPPIYRDSRRMQPSSQANQPHKYTSEYTREEPKYETKEKSWRDRTRTGQSQSSSEDDKEEASHHQQKLEDELKEEIHAEEKRTLRSAKFTDKPPVRIGTPGGVSDAGLNKIRHYEEEKRRLRSASREEGSVLYNRYRQDPKENTVLPPVQPKSGFSFSDDDEEQITPFQQKIDFQSRHGGGDKMNHYSARNTEQKGKAVRKPPTTSFTHLAGTCMKFLFLALIALLLGVAAVFYISPESILEVLNQGKTLLGQQVKKDLTGDFENLTSLFTNQSPLMWKRSRRILEIHLDKWNNNAEPAILLLTGARDAELTLLCLGTQLADIYSSSLNGNYTVISGSDWASGSNEEVKEYIDHNLSTGFQATTRATVLHRIERLPAGSLLILYKYCDHETAVFKNVMLLLTVLLDEPTLEKDISLLDLEDKVRAFLIRKLIDSETQPSHDGMDEDKFSGVWSRISHVVLPVYPEKNTIGQCLKKQN